MSEQMKRYYTIKVGLTLACVGLASASHAHSDEIICGNTYVVEKADSLSRISEWAYGTSRYVEELHAANIDVIGPDWGNLTIGMALNIPCFDDEIAVETQNANVEAAQAADAATETEQDSDTDLMSMADTLLTVDGFDAEKVVALLQSANLPDSEKSTLSGAVVVAKDDPVVLRHVLAHISRQLGL